MKIKIVFTFLMAAIFNSCYYDNKEELFQDFPQDCITTGLTYTLDIKPIVDANCIGCHSPSGSQFPFLDTYLNVRSNEFEVMNRITRPAGSAGAMPVSGPMSDCNIEKLNVWYQDGAPE